MLKMKISLIVNSFPPEIGSAADLFYQLGMELYKKGHIINVFTTETRDYKLSEDYKYNFNKAKKNNNKFLIWKMEIIKTNFTIYRIKLLPFIYPKSGKSAFYRQLEHILQPFLFLTIVNKLLSSDILLVYSPPLLLGFISTIIGKLIKIPTIINVQDIHPQAIIDLGLIKNCHLSSLLKIIERLMYKYASAITVHSNGNKKIIIDHCANPQKVFTIYNVCNIPSDNLIKEGILFRKKHSLKDKFVITYAGTMSFSQDLDTIIKALYLLSKNNERFVLLLVGDGPQRRELELLKKKLKIPNVIFLPFQEGDDYWRLLSASDVCLVSLKKSKVKTPVVPRKLEDIMAAGKPVIANVPLDGDIKKIIEKANCGISVESENPESLSQAIKRIYDMSEEIRLRYGNNGRLYALESFAPQVIVKKYEILFDSMFEK